MSEIEDILKKIRKFRDDRDWVQFHNPKDLAAAISIEAAELLEIFLWKKPEELEETARLKRQPIEEEIADIATFLFELSDNLGIDLIKAIEAKMVKNALKYPADRVRGSAKKYSEYEPPGPPAANLLSFPPKSRKTESERPAAGKGRVLQFRVSLLHFEPEIWRRILVKDGTLDDLHEHIQTAMGWTNSHLHQFAIGDEYYGDPGLLDDGFEDSDPHIDSMATKISSILPEDGSPLSFHYEYDFGDGWEHEIRFEGWQPAEPGQRYPICVEGERACPPEDVGGVAGYDQFLEALSDPDHESREEFLEWIGGKFDPAKFSVKKATAAMRRGLPDRLR